MSLGQFGWLEHMENTIMATATVSDDDFETEVLNSSEPVVVDFWAEWCSPCKAIAPALEEISEEMSGQVKVAKINIDENPNVPGKYGIRAIPTLLIFKGGEVAATQTGALPKNKLADWIKSSL